MAFDRLSYLLGGLWAKTMLQAFPRWRDARAKDLIKKRFIARVTDGDRVFLWPHPSYGTGRDETNGAPRWKP